MNFEEELREALIYYHKHKIEPEDHPAIRDINALSKENIIKIHKVLDCIISNETGHSDAINIVYRVVLKHIFPYAFIQDQRNNDIISIIDRFRGLDFSRELMLLYFAEHRINTPDYFLLGLKILSRSSMLDTETFKIMLRTRGGKYIKMAYSLCAIKDANLFNMLTYISIMRQLKLGHTLSILEAIHILKDNHLLTQEALDLSLGPHISRPDIVASALTKLNHYGLFTSNLNAIQRFSDINLLLTFIGLADHAFLTQAILNSIIFYDNHKLIFFMNSLGILYDSDLLNINNYYIVYQHTNIERLNRILMLITQEGSLLTQETFSLIANHNQIKSLYRIIKSSHFSGIFDEQLIHILLRSNNLNYLDEIFLLLKQYSVFENDHIRIDTI